MSGPGSLNPRGPGQAPAAPERHRRFAGKRALVMGLGHFGGGAGAARYLAGLGARVLVTDRRPAAGLARARSELEDLPLEYVLGEHRRQDFERAELVVVNPAVRPDDPLLASARRAGAQLTSEIELFLEATEGRVVAVTGTQGKSSTAHITHALLVACGLRAHLGGNIGTSLLPALAHIEADDPVILELSSYQLEGLGGSVPARAEAVVVLNLLADHLERHGSLEAYARAKRRVFELLRPGGWALLPRDDERFAGWAGAGLRHLGFTPEAADDGLCIRDGAFWLDGELLGRLSDLHLPGDFQRANALVALGLARILGASPQALARALGSVGGLEHRLQDLGLVRGRRVIDNAVSTTPDSTLSALLALPGPTVLILGGRPKGLPLAELARVARERVALAVVFGEAGPSFRTALAAQRVPLRVVPGVEQAVSAAFAHGPDAVPVLFSPAASSFDTHANFEQRAQAFRTALEAQR